MNLKELMALNDEADRAEQWAHDKRVAIDREIGKVLGVPVIRAYADLNLIFTEAPPPGATVHQMTDEDGKVSDVYAAVIDGIDVKYYAEAEP
jgi:hypothetical protein